MKEFTVAGPWGRNSNLRLYAIITGLRKSVAGRENERRKEIV